MTNLDIYYQRMQKLGTKIDTFNSSYDSKYTKVNKKLDEVCSKLNKVDEICDKNSGEGLKQEFYVKKSNGLYDKCEIVDFIDKNHLCSEILKGFNKEDQFCGHKSCQFKAEC